MGGGGSQRPSPEARDLEGDWAGGGASAQGSESPCVRIVGILLKLRFSESLRGPFLRINRY